MEEKLTKYGVSAALIGALAYFLGTVGMFYAIALFVIVLVLDFGKEAKKRVATAVLFCVVYALVMSGVNYLSSFWLDFCNLFNSMHQVYSILVKLNIFGYIYDILGFVKYILVVVFVVISLRGKDVKIPMISKMVAKHFGEEETAEA